MPKNGLISTTSELKNSLDKICEEKLYAIDTEFMGEGNYIPRLSLIQIGYRDETILIDPLGVDPSPLADFFQNSNLAIMHAPDQDLKLLMNYCGAIPGKIFDTQIASGFLGGGHPSLEELVYTYVGKSLSKNTRLTDWLKRPLSKEQVDYAREDVVYLIEIYENIQKELEKRGRESWASKESESMRLGSQSFTSPNNSWKSIKKIKSLKGLDLNLARELSSWRELKAKKMDSPRRKILSDLAVLNIAQTRPATLSALRSLRGVSGSVFANSANLKEILEIVKTIQKNPPRNYKNEVDKKQAVTQKRRPAMNLLVAWLNAYALNLEIYPPLLATRNDISEYFDDPPHGRLLEGWREMILGDSLKRIAAGETAIAIAEDGNLILEERSHRPLNL